jgi:hypothetical protein
MSLIHACAHSNDIILAHLIFEQPPNSYFIVSIALHLAKMTTIPSRLASVSAISGTQQIARQRVRALYRDWYRSVRPQSLVYYLLLSMNTK